MANAVQGSRTMVNEIRSVDDGGRKRLSLAGGGALHYAEAGRGTPILLIHGTGCDGFAWFDSFSRFAATHHVIAYDRRGFGESSAAPTAGYFHQQAEDGLALIEHVGAGPVTVVGHSAGGIVALDLAVNHPEVVARLILLEPPYHLKKHLTASFAVGFIRVQLVRRLRGTQRGASAFMRLASGRTDGRVSFDELPIDVRQRTLASANGLMVELDAGTGEGLGENRVSGIRAPVLLLEGSLSQPIFRKLSQRLSRTLPHAHVQVVPGAGHFIQFDQPGEFERAVLSVAG